MKEVRVFLGFANIYRRFIPVFSTVANHLTQLTPQDLVFPWSPKAQVAFDTLKQAFTSAPILMYFDPHRAIGVETDASDYVSVAIMSQYEDRNTLRLVDYLSKKYSPAECNYEIYDNELLAVIEAFEE